MLTAVQTLETSLYAGCVSRKTRWVKKVTSSKMRFVNIHHHTKLC